MHTKDQPPKIQPDHSAHFTETSTNCAILVNTLCVMGPFSCKKGKVTYLSRNILNLILIEMTMFINQFILEPKEAY